MKMTLKHIVLSAGLVASLQTLAGNEDRVGSAGASHLLVNPWARSGAIGDASYANSNGLEATYMNIAGLAFTDKTQMKFNYSNWMGSAGIALNGAGIAQRISDSEVFSISVQSMNYGDIPITTVANPEGNIGFFSPRMNIFSVGYAKEFSSSIYGGINFKVISESISNMKANGIAIDAGIRYVSGEQDQLKFGITLKNVGPVMRYKGDGMTVSAVIPSSGNTLTVEQRSQAYEMPSMVNVGFAYDFLMKNSMKLTANAAYTSNSFSKDQVALGLEYNLRNRLFLRGGYQQDIGSNTTYNAKSALSGPTGGLTVQLPTGDNGSVIGLDYSYRMTNPFNGIHSMGIHITL